MTRLSSRVSQTFAACLLSACALCLCAAGQTTAPAATPQQQQFIDSLRDKPADQPAPRYNTKLTINGQPNPDFGKQDADSLKKHQMHLQRKQKPIGLLFLGDSITEAWNRADDIWKERYAPHQAANFGIAGDRTEHVLWRIENGALDGISPEVVVLLIGTNNVGRHSAEQIADGITAIVRNIHAKLPHTKVLLVGPFPRSATPDSTRAKLEKVNQIVSRLDDGKKTRYLEVWKQFLGEDGSIAPDVMPDALHPSPKGYRIWADALQPLLDEMLAKP